MPVPVISIAQMRDWEQATWATGQGGGTPIYGPTSAGEHQGGRFLVRGGPHEVFEGDWQPSRMVLVEFPDLAAARVFYDSAKYREARAQRAGATEFFNMVVVQGVDRA